MHGEELLYSFPKLNCVKDNPSLRPKSDDLLQLMVNIAHKYGIIQNKNISNENSSSIDIHQNNATTRKFEIENKMKIFYEIGLKYYYGYGCQEDIKQAIHYFTISADGGYSDAQLVLSDIYIQGIDVKVNLEKFLYYLTLSANSNNIEALFRLGVFYSERRFNSIDLDKALHYLRLAANKNHPGAFFQLGYIYSQGEIISRDIKKAINYYMLASNLNNSSAQYNLGKLYYEGKYILRDIKKSIIFFNLHQNIPILKHYILLVQYTISNHHQI